jgi:hypothetical protein
MALHIITADERLARKPKVNVALFAPAGWGKTYQARTLDAETTLFIDLEAGTLALNGDREDGADAWRGSIVSVREEAAKINVHPWEFARALVCLLGGADPAAAPGTPYAADQLAIYEQMIAPRSAFDQFTTIFFDSITVASRLSFSWAKRQPEAISEKTGKPDTRGAYGLHGQEMVTWLTQAQHIPNKSIVVVGILDETKDDFGRKEFSPQIEGGKAGRELPGIFDQVITGAMFDVSSGAPVMDMQKGTERGFVCHLNNGFGVPGKDRSGRLALLEAPNLGALLRKIQSGPRVDTPNFTSGGSGADPIPAQQASAEGA